MRITAYLKVDSDKRLSLPADLLRAVGWIKDELQPVTCLAVCGPRGGVQLAIKDGVLWQQRLTMEREPEPEENEVDAAWMDEVRFFSAMPDIPLHIHGEQLRFTIPEEAEKLGRIRRSYKTVVAVFVAGKVLELWDAASLGDHQQRIAATRTEREGTVEESLTERRSDASE